MEDRAKAQPWGRLVKMDPGAGSEVLLVNKECTVGRRRGCDLSFPANKLVSGDHCKIVQDEHSGEVWLEDMSTNGTVINMSKLVKKQVHPLQSGDVIYFVYRKNDPEQNIAYVYHSIPLQSAGLRHATASPEQAGAAQDEPQPSTSSSHVFCTSTPVACPAEAHHGGPQMASSGSETSLPSHDGPGPEPVDTRVKPPCTGDVRKTEARDDETEPERKRRKTEKDYDFDLPDTEATEAEGPHKEPVEAHVRKGAAEGSKVDKMEESLTCIICQDLLYDCVSLQPCMHTFCAACYSSWMERSSLCPTCRCPVERIRKNHILNNLVEAYLLQHPEKSRSEEDLKNMDMRNKITEDMVQPKLERSLSDEEGSSDYLFELSDNDSDTSDVSQPFVMCRQCPGYRKDGIHGASVSGAMRGEQIAKPLGEGPSTSASTPSALLEYTCPLQGSHVICTCCLQPMPDRRSELTNHPLFTQQCATCHLPFCHMYWGCQRIGCQGCLAPFSELNLTEKCLDGVLNSNNYESDVLQNYLASRGMSWKEMLQDSLQALQQGTFHLSDYRITANTVLCHCCGLRAFKELAYKYRQNIPASELPAAVTSRPDCYWGRNCRTQVKAHHAMKFNHICEQTRFKN
ncbi:E3 ubiquitin-protein ligase CHFR isoform X2 [Brienomyrus brachyistius]|uniref:E3 ubiquitin-protein ligase CHFR isoform X2 n=1 Tax=Brienomyrus brachyistius TaxID=42636 RepID=UPI0020B30D4F|nr:E3 ubiquitin-protein ligase CHFR isoform X2 [Brienomyrus brachyistius]